MDCCLVIGSIVELFLACLLRAHAFEADVVSLRSGVSWCAVGSSANLSVNLVFLKITMSTEMGNNERRKKEAMTMKNDTTEAVNLNFGVNFHHQNHGTDLPHCQVNHLSAILQWWTEKTVWTELKLKAFKTFDEEGNMLCTEQMNFAKWDNIAFAIGMQCERFPKIKHFQWHGEEQIHLSITTSPLLQHSHCNSILKHWNLCSSAFQELAARLAMDRFPKERKTTAAKPWVEAQAVRASPGKWVAIDHMMGQKHNAVHWFLQLQKLFAVSSHCHIKAIHVWENLFGFTFGTNSTRRLLSQQLTSPVCVTKVATKTSRNALGKKNARREHHLSHKCEIVHQFWTTTNK